MLYGRMLRRIIRTMRFYFYGFHFGEGSNLRLLKRFMSHGKSLGLSYLSAAFGLPLHSTSDTGEDVRLIYLLNFKGEKWLLVHELLQSIENPYRLSISVIDGCRSGVLRTRGTCMQTGEEEENLECRLLRHNQGPLAQIETLNPRCDVHLFHFIISWKKRIN